MTMRRVFPLLPLILLACAASAWQGPATDDEQLPPSYVPSGKIMYKQYCASCHGADGKGHGPATPTLNVRVPDLTTLSKRHGGKFPFEYVESVLRFGPGFRAHGSADMPVWGPIFQYLENYNETAVRQRIRNLCEFLGSIQQR